MVPQGHVNSLVIEPDLVKSVKIIQRCDDFVHKIKRDIKNGKPAPFTIDSKGASFFKGRLVVTHSKGRHGNLNQTPHVMKEAHDTPLSIHLGSTKMYQDIRQRYWWPGMKQDIARYVDECDICRRVKEEHQRPAGTLQPLSIPEWKWDKIEMDFVTGFPRSQKANDATDSPKFLIFCLSRRRSLLASWQTYVFLELFPSTVFHWRSVQIEAA